MILKSNKYVLTILCSYFRTVSLESQHIMHLKKKTGCYEIFSSSCVLVTFHIISWLYYFNEQVGLKLGFFRSWSNVPALFLVLKPNSGSALKVKLACTSHPGPGLCGHVRYLQPCSVLWTQQVGLILALTWQILLKKNSCAEDVYSLVYPFPVADDWFPQLLKTRTFLLLALCLIHPWDPWALHSQETSSLCPSRSPEPDSATAP